MWYYCVLHESDAGSGSRGTLEGQTTMQRRWLNHLLFSLLLSCALFAQTPGAAPGATPAAALPGGGTRNAELQARLEAEIAGSGAHWDISIRHVERNEGAGVRELEPFQTASVFKVGVLVELFGAAREGKLKLDERVAWQHPERTMGSGLLALLQPGLQPTIHDLAT